MPTFGLITEGVTDQQVIQAVLDGFFDPEEVDVRPFLPIADNTHRHQVQSFSNWQLALDYCASPKFSEAFAFVEYIVVQIDTDQCDDPKFGVQKHKEGILLPPEQIVAGVAAKLQEKIGEAVWSLYHERILFAVAVDTIECWLLPLYAEGKDKSKTLSCLDVLNRSLQRKNKRPVNVQSKEPRLYADLAKPYSRRRELQSHSGENPSLAMFIERLNAVFNAPTDNITPAAATEIVLEGDISVANKDADQQ